MPVTLSEPLVIEEAELTRRKLWTRDECDALVEAGILNPKRYELLEGELVEKVSKNDPHMRAVMRLYNRLNRIFGEDLVLQEASIRLTLGDTPYNDPEPDLIALNRPFVTKASAADIVLIVEVSETTLATDLRRKAALYARAGFPDYWVLDLKRRRMIVHRDPAEGAYRSITIFSENEPVTPLGAPTASIRVADLL